MRIMKYILAHIYIVLILVFMYGNKPSAAKGTSNDRKVMSWLVEIGFISEQDTTRFSAYKISNNTYVVCECYYDLKDELLFKSCAGEEFVVSYSTMGNIIILNISNINLGYANLFVDTVLCVEANILNENEFRGINALAQIVFKKYGLFKCAYIDSVTGSRVWYHTDKCKLSQLAIEYDMILVRNKAQFSKLWIEYKDTFLLDYTFRADWIPVLVNKQYASLLDLKRESINDSICLPIYWRSDLDTTEFDDSVSYSYKVEKWRNNGYELFYENATDIFIVRIR